MDTEYLIRFILIHEPKTDLRKLELLSLEELVIFKVQLEINLKNELLKKMEYRIKEQHRLKGVFYLTPPYNTRTEAETELQIIISNNKDIDSVYTIVYGKSYSQGSQTGTFAEFPEVENL